MATFQPGHTTNVGRSNPNAGRKPDAVKSALRALFSSVFTADEQREVAHSVLTKAKTGDVGAASFLFSMTYGTADERLAEARAILAKQQANELLPAQTKNLEAQTAEKYEAIALVSKSLVTEEQERERLQRLFLAITRPILYMTPEIAEQFGVSQDKLQDFKEYLSVEMDEAMREAYAEPEAIAGEEEEAEE